MLTGFTDFLLRYCQELGGTDCCDLRTLCSLAANNTARMMEPLFLYATYSNQLDELLVLARDTRMENEYERLSELVRSYSVDDYYDGMDNDESWPRLYRKVFDAYAAYLKHDGMNKKYRDRLVNRCRFLFDTTKLSISDVAENTGLPHERLTSEFENAEHVFTAPELRTVAAYLENRIPIAESLSAEKCCSAI